MSGEAQQSGAGADTRPPLDDVMLAMDVVDTMRRRERVAQTELAERDREQDLKERLRTIYNAQGIEVPDRVIEQAVAALKEGRFTYQPPPSSYQTRLARLYVTRGRWGRWVGGLVFIAVLAFTLHHWLFVVPRAALPEELARVHTQVMALARTERDRATLDRYYHLGAAAVGTEDREGARLALDRLNHARQTLEQEYTVRIVNRPGQQSGVWRIPDINTGARNDYLIVEAVDPAGRILSIPIENEETRQTETVDRWGLRVDQDTFNAVARDKKDNGIIDRDRFGYKSRGALVPHYEMKTTGGAITQW